MNSNYTYREEVQDLIFDLIGTRNVLDVPLNRFEDRSRIRFEKIRGSVRLMNNMVATEKEAETYINKVLKARLP